MLGCTAGRAGCIFLALAALVLLFVPSIAGAQTAAGSFTSVSGPVQIQRAGATIGAASGIGVDVGDRILTGADGHAVIVLNDQSKLDIAPSSNITLDQFTLTGGTATTRVGLVSGALRSLVTAATGGAAANYQVHTPNAVAAVRGTDFDTTYIEGAARPGYQGCQRYTDVRVREGVVAISNVANPGETVNVDAGFETTVPCMLPPLNAGPLGITGAAGPGSSGGGRSAGGAAAAISGFSAPPPGGGSSAPPPPAPAPPPGLSTGIGP
jgi:FecR protein